LKLEVNPKGLPKNADVEALKSKGISITPPVGEDWWLYRVAVGGEQAVVAFPKFGLIAIGFQKEKDWNTNLPASLDAEEIYNHIQHNKTDIPKKEDCVRAIRMIQDHIKG